LKSSIVINTSIFLFQFEMEKLLKQQDPFDIEMEQRWRSCIIHFIQEAGIKLNFPQLTTSTAAFLLHQFFSRKSFKDHDKWLIATCCLFLASKLEETPKKLRDIINTTYCMLREKALRIGPEYWSMHDSIIVQEQVIMRVLAFETAFDHPHKYLLNYAKSLRVSKTFIQTSLNVLNDSFCTSVYLRYGSNVIAAAVIYFTASILNVELPQGSRMKWWEAFDIEFSDIEAICHTILDLYEHPTSWRTLWKEEQLDKD